MAELYAASSKPLSLYKDRRYGGNQKEREMRLRESCTLYIGNLSFYTREEQILDLFSRIGEVRRVIMGLDRIRKTPCGFCFVEYFTRSDAEKSVDFLSGTKLDERIIRVDYDVGYSAGRQYGRGRSGGQVRDEHRLDYDPGRGGFGKAVGQQTGTSGMELWGPQHSRNEGPSPPLRATLRNGYGSREGPAPGRGRGGWGRGRIRNRGGRGRGRGSGQHNGDAAFPARDDSNGQQGGFKRGRYHDGRESHYDVAYQPMQKIRRTSERACATSGGPISGRPTINGPPQGFGALPGFGGTAGASAPIRIDGSLPVEGKGYPPQRGRVKSEVQIVTGRGRQLPSGFDLERNAG